MLAPHDTIPFSPVIDKLGACRVPSTEAPLVTAWDSDGTRELRETMLATAAAAAAVAVMFGRGRCTLAEWRSNKLT